jgi:pyruvate kinase
MRGAPPLGGAFSQQPLRGEESRTPDRATEGPAVPSDGPRRRGFGSRSGRKALLCTLGPSSLDPAVLAGLEEAGVTGFRINLSHTELEDVEPILKFLAAHSRTPVWLDTEGAQIRTGAMRPRTELKAGRPVRLVRDPVVGDATTIPLTPASALASLEPGARISVDFDSVLLRVERVRDGVAEAVVLVGGEVGTHKAVTAFPSPRLPPLSPKDLRAVDIGRRLGVQEYALSFCDHASAVSQLRERVGPESRILAKIETREGVRNLGKIAEVADGLLIDRGDLSREVRLEAIPLLQKAIIRKANALRVPVFVATNLLESMVARRAPTRAEVNDVMNTLLDGADGLVLAAETAIGRHPVEAARMITTLLREYEGSFEGYRIEDLLGHHPLSVDHLPRVELAPPPTVRHSRLSLRDRLARSMPEEPGLATSSRGA